MADDPLTHAVMVESAYRLYLKRLFPDSEKNPPDPEIAAVLHEVIGLAPSEFRKMGKRQRLPFIKQAIAATTAAIPAPPDPPAKPIGRPRKGQPRATVNARMIDELQRNPAAKDWTSREWAKRLGCAKFAVEKTKSWKMIIATREAAKSDRKARSPKRYEE